MEHAAVQILLLLLIGCLVALVARRFKVPYTLALGATTQSDLDPSLLAGPFAQVRTFGRCHELAEALQSGFAHPVGGAH